VLLVRGVTVSQSPPAGAAGTFWKGWEKRRSASLPKYVPDALALLPTCVLKEIHMKGNTPSQPTRERRSVQRSKWSWLKRPETFRLAIALVRLITTVINALNR